MHHIDGAIAVLLAGEFNLIGIHIRAQPIAPEAAVRIGLNDEELFRAFDLDFHAHVGDGAETFDVLCLSEIGMAVFMEIFRLEVGLAGQCGRGCQQESQSSQDAKAAL